MGKAKKSGGKNKRKGDSSDDDDDSNNVDRRVPREDVPVRHLGDGFIEIDPAFIYFTHARIRPFFTGCGRRVEDTLTDISEGRLSIEALPKITVISNNGSYFSLNNRRLFVLKHLRAQGVVTVITARTKVALEREKDRYKVDRCSLTAKIMKEKTKEEGDGDDTKGSDDVDDECVDDAGAAMVDG
jgi:hypothetical protein